MWLYIPSGFTDSHSVPESARLNSDSVLHLETLTAVFVWSRGKPLQSQRLSVVWRRVTWIRALSGITLSPSTANHGVESWISSLLGCPVKDTPSPANNEVTKTSDHLALTDAVPFITPCESSESVVPPWSPLKTSLFGSLPDTFGESERSWQDWVTRSKVLSSSVRRTLERAIKGKGCSSSLIVDRSAWPTAGATDGESVRDETPEHWQARRERLKAANPNLGDLHCPLTMAVQQWATATSHERTQTPRSVDHGEQLANQADQWITPHGMQSTDKTGKTGSGGEFAEAAVKAMDLWETPKAKIAQDCPAERARNSPALESQANLADVPSASWMTPMARDHVDGACKDHNTPTNSILSRQVCRSTLPDQTTATDGNTSSNDGRGSLLPSQKRRLNPYFVEWLMNMPPFWTSPIALTACGRQAMRSALCRLQRHFEFCCRVLGI